MKRRFLTRALLPAIAAVMVIAAAAAPSMSYFTTYVTARGEKLLELENVRIIPHENVQSNVKNISIENTGEAECYVRVRVESSDEVPVRYAGAGWTDGGDGYWYYGALLQPGETTAVLAATIDLPTSSPEKPIPEGTELNVIVLSEGAPVLYDDAGAAKPNGPAYEGWTLQAKEG